MLRFGVVVSSALAFAVSVQSAHAGAMIGAHVGFPGDPNYAAKIDELESQIGKKFAIDAEVLNWETFPDIQHVRWDAQTGHLPVQSWRVVFSNSNPNACATAAAIIAGTYDTLLAQQAAVLRSFGGKILVRFNQEMTDNPENTCFTGFPVSQNVPLAGQEFISAWRHVVAKFRANGATNVQWVWCPGAGAFWQNIWSYFYPGPSWVDWVGIDDYNPVDTPASFATDPGIPEFITAGATLGKPMMIADTGAFQDPTANPDAQTTWISTAHTFVKAHPQIQAFIYWDAQSDNNIKEPPPPYAGTGYVLSGTGKTAFKAMANDPYFNGQ